MKRTYLLLIALIGLTTLANAQWINTNGPDSGNVVSCIASKGINTFVGTGYNGIYLSVNNGSWNAIDSGLTKPDIYSLAINDSAVFAGTALGGVFVTKDNGVSWNASNNGLYASFIYSLAINDTNIFAGTELGVFLSHDNGANWAKTDTTLGFDIFALAAKDSNIYAGTVANKIYHSTNNGTNWKYVGYGLPDAAINALIIIDSVVLAGTNGLGVYRIINNDTVWTNASNGLPTGVNVWAFATSGKYIFAGTIGNGVFISADYGANWVAVNDGLDSLNMDIYSLAINGNTIYAGTYNGYVWKRSLQEIISSGITEININKDISIYPNPAKDNVTIKINNNSLQDYIATLRNIQGQVVISKKISFVNTYNMDISGNPNGLYILTLQNEKEQIVKKVIVQH